MSILRIAFPKEVRGFCYILGLAAITTVALLLLEAFASEFFNPFIIYSVFVFISFIALSTTDSLLFKGEIHNSAKIGIYVTIVLTAASAAYFAVYNFVMTPLGLGYFYIVAFTLIVGGLAMLIKVPASNCAVFGVFLLNQESFLVVVVYAFGAGLIFTAVLVMFSGIRERLIIDDAVPDKLDGAPLAVLVAALMAIVFFGFTGL